MKSDRSKIIVFFHGSQVMMTSSKMVGPFPSFLLEMFTYVVSYSQGSSKLTITGSIASYIEYI